MKGPKLFNWITFVAGDDPIWKSMTEESPWYDEIERKGFVKLNRALKHARKMSKTHGAEVCVAKRKNFRKCNSGSITCYTAKNGKRHWET